MIMNQALSRLRVIDMTQNQAGPGKDSLDGFPGTFRTKPKTRIPGDGKRRRWKIGRQI
jgi:hypothetical protein